MSCKICDMPHTHDARTTLAECVRASLLALANGEEDPAGPLNHGLEALDVLVRMVEEARQVAESLYWEHDIEERVHLLAHSPAQPAWLVDSETDLLTLTPPPRNAVPGDLPERRQPPTPDAHPLEGRSGDAGWADEHYGDGQDVGTRDASALLNVATGRRA